nr:hypothetical protein [Tanacetum cinerariifolium]
MIIAALRDELRKLKGKAIVNNVVTSHTIAPNLFKVDVEPLALKLLKNRTAHSDYIRHTQEQAAILKEVVEQGKLQNHLNNSLDHAYLHIFGTIVLILCGPTVSFLVAVVSCIIFLVLIGGLFGSDVAFEDGVGEKSFVGVDVKSKTIEDIISNRSFMEVLVLNHYVLVKNVFRTPKSLTLEIHHGGWFTPTPSRSYIGGHVSSVNVVDIDEFCLHDLKDMIVKLEAPILVECDKDPFEELDDILGEYAHIRKQITRNDITRNESIGNEITGKQMIVHVCNSSTVNDVLELDMLFETEGVGLVRKFKEVEFDADNESEEESDTGGDYTMDSDSEDLDYDPKHDDVFDDDEHTVKEVHVNMNNFRFTIDPKHDTSIDDGIDSKRRMQLRSLARSILTAVGVDANNGIYPVAYAIVEAESKASWQKGLIQAIASVFPSAEHMYCVRHIHENMKSRFKGDSIRTMEQSLFFRAKCDLLINNIREVFNMQLVDGRDQSIVTCLEYIEKYLMKRIMVVQKVIAKTIGPLTPSVTKVFDAIKKATEDMWPVVESRTVIIPPLYKPLIGRLPKKRKKSNDKIASQSVSSGKLSRKGKSISCGKYDNMGHNRKGCRGQGGSSSQAGARKVSSQAVSATNVSGEAAGARKVSGQAVGATNIVGQAVGARKVFGQAAGATNVSGQVIGARKVSGQAAGSRKVSGQAADARKASSQPSAVQSVAKQGLRQGFQGPIAGPAYG